MKLSLNQKIILGFLVLMITYGGLGYISVKNLDKSREITNQNLLINQPSLILLNELKLLIVNSKNFTSTWFKIDISSHPDKISLKKIHEQDYPELKARVNIMKLKWADDADVDSINSIITGFDEVLAMQQTIMTTLPDIDSYNDFLVMVEVESTFENVEFAISQVLAHLNHLIDKIKKRADKEDEEMLVSFKFIRYSNIFLSIIAVIIGVVVTIAILRAVRIEEQKRAAIAERDAVQEQKEIIEEKNEEIMASIRYAQRIQKTILPPEEVLKEQIDDLFVFYRPRDIVSGDFYWCINQKDEGIVWIAAADCTGHGVPGAFISFVCSKALSDCVNELGINKPAEVLDQTTALVEAAFEQGDMEDVKDGMDIALAKIDFANKKLEFAGAYNPLFLISKGELEAFKGDRQPIGACDDRVPFTNHEIDLQTGDSIYLFSDGFSDQFGGPKNKRYQTKQFKEFLTSIYELEMNEQHDKIEKELDDWRGEEQQIDDVLVIGIRV